MTCIKTGCDDSPSSLSPRVPGGWESSRSKSSWLNFPQRARSYHSRLLCRCQQVYGWWMSKSVTIARFSLTSCMFWNARLLPLWQVEEFNERNGTKLKWKWVIVATLKWFRQIKPQAWRDSSTKSTLFARDWDFVQRSTALTPLHNSLLISAADHLRITEFNTASALLYHRWMTTYYSYNREH